MVAYITAASGPALRPPTLPFDDYRGLFFMGIMLSRRAADHLLRLRMWRFTTFTPPRSFMVWFLSTATIWAGIAQSVYWLVRAGRSWDWIPVRARFSAPVQTGPGAHPASYTMGTGSFPGVRRRGRGVDHPLSSSAEVKERVELYLYSPSGLLGWTLPLTLQLQFVFNLRSKIIWSNF